MTMARFLALASGRAQAATRLGTPSSGIRTEARGWHSGVTVYGAASGDHDVFTIFATGGSTDNGVKVAIGTVTRDDDGRVAFTPHNAS